MPNDTQQQTTDLVNQYLDLHKQQDKLEEELKNLKKSVARVVGGYSEGSGFFGADNQILTSFHVIADEPSPKVIFFDGSFSTPYKIIESIKT